MNLTKASKYLALILRHKPEEIGIKLEKNGWADTAKVVKGVSMRFSGFNMETLEEIVRTDSKQRYSFTEDKKKIRANQGHSVDVEIEFDEVEPPDVLFHGTATRFMDSIFKDGLCSMTRQYVHLSGDHDTAVIVGSRHGKPIVFRVDCQKMVEDGFRFYRSANGVWLTSHVPAKYLSIDSL